MVSLNVKRKLQAAVLILFALTVAYAKVTGPDAGYTNAPGDLGSCVACHDTFHEANVGPGSVRVEGDPITNGYVPGQQYTLRVTVQQASRRKFGFQLTAIDMNGNRAGTFESLGGDTQVNPETGLGGRQYIEHTQPGTNTAVVGSRTWQVRWTAPITDIGTVRFYVAGNAANGDDTNQNDYIYTSSAIAESPTSKVSIQLQSNLDGLILEAGTKITINWATTGQQNVDNYEARYSTDDGATFPITNLIFSTTDASVTSFEWTVPNTPTNQARIRISGGTKTGAPITPVISGRFSIVVTGGSGGTVPKISGASVSGKKLVVTGENFGAGASLYMCFTSCATPASDGDKVKKVSNDADFPTNVLVARKAGKSIERGSTVMLQVKNPDGTLSEPFTFTRPLE
ncbi:MAG TPA: choice-of-anchor V domain-containing protein [Blastocatellia bacterium]|nr:choice-of-anchor V domain-containing protein [Blastocatellia bacterium]